MEIWVNKPEKVKLTENQIEEITKYRLKQLLGGDGITEYKGERWVYTWYDTGHGSGYTEHNYQATDLDEAVVKVLQFLK